MRRFSPPETFYSLITLTTSASKWLNIIFVGLLLLTATYCELSLSSEELRNFQPKCLPVKFSHLFMLLTQITLTVKKKFYGVLEPNRGYMKILNDIHSTLNYTHFSSYFASTRAYKGGVVPFWNTLGGFIVQI